LGETPDGDWARSERERVIEMVRETVKERVRERERVYLMERLVRAVDTQFRLSA
jgi:hypothetical protein